jgi:hypothetical protein
LSGKTKAAKLQYLGDVYRSVERSNRNVIKGEEVGALVKTLLERSKVGCWLESFPPSPSFFMFSVNLG